MAPMGDLKHPGLMWLKAALFVAIGTTSAALILVDQPSLRTLVLLLLVTWSSARAYYFCFYVIEKYIDPSYKFAGLGSVVRHVISRRGAPKP